MKTWIDNTGFQSAGRFLLGKPQEDLSPVYQLATIIAFSNSITLTGFEDLEVATTTSEVMKRLDPSSDVIQMRSISRSSYQDCCQKAASFCGTYFEKISFLSMDERTLEYPVGLSKASIEKQIDIGLKVIFTDSPSELDELCDQVKEQAAAGAAAYILCSNTNLRLKSRKLFTSPDDNRAIYRQLENLLRYHLNTELAEEAEGSIYAPALGRSRLLRSAQENEFRTVSRNLPSTELSKLLDSFKREMNIGVPSIHQYFERLGKNDPDRVLKLALEIREKTSDLRRRLESKLATIDSIHNHNDALDQEISEIGNNIRMNMGLDSAPTFWGAFDLSFVTAIPPIAISLSGKELVQWWNFKRASKRNSILTEISRTIRS